MTTNDRHAGFSANGRPHMPPKSMGRGPLRRRLPAIGGKDEPVVRQRREIRPAIGWAVRGVAGSDHHLGKVRPIGGHRAICHKAPEAVGVENGADDVLAEDSERSHLLRGGSAGLVHLGACRARMRTRCPSTSSVSPSSAAASPSTSAGCRASPACGGAGRIRTAADTKTALRTMVSTALVSREHRSDSGSR